MATEIMKPARTLISSGRIEKQGLVVTGILSAANAVLGSYELALGAAAGGALVLLNFIAIKLVINTLVENAHTVGFSVFVVILKLAALVAVVVALFVFAKVNIYGFLIGVAGVVIVIIGESLRGSKNGAL